MLMPMMEKIVQTAKQIVNEIVESQSARLALRYLDWAHPQSISKSVSIGDCFPGHGIDLRWIKPRSSALTYMKVHTLV